MFLGVTQVLLRSAVVADRRVSPGDSAASVCMMDGQT